MPDHKISITAAPLRMKAIEAMRNAITSFDYKPGTRLVERELCERYGVSRTVIREALRQLEAEGLVQIIANQGPIVSFPTVDEAQSLYEVREALESLAARRCAARATRAQKQQLQKAIADVATAYKTGSRDEHLRAIDEFYAQLCEFAQNPVLTTMLLGINMRVRALRALTLGSPGRAQEGLDELRQIVRRIVAGDVDGAGELAAEHVRNAAAVAYAMASSNDMESLRDELTAASGTSGSR